VPLWALTVKELIVMISSEKIILFISSHLYKTCKKGTIEQYRVVLNRVKIDPVELIGKNYNFCSKPVMDDRIKSLLSVGHLPRDM
jgi:hypothetical protein